MEFKHFLGNEKIKAQLSALVDGGRLPHAVVLEGESGLGKRTLAGELAAALVCRGEHRPCDSCPQCHKARAGVHPDILVYAPEGGARSFHKKTVDQIVGDVYMTPNEADYRIYILVNAHLMSVQAQNAILKVLEEPPAYVRFILTVENKSALLPTVLSRSVVFRLEGVPVEIGADYILQRQPEADPDRVRQALQLWNGNIGKAMESLEDGEAAKYSALSAELCRALVAETEYALICACAPLQKDRQAVLNICGVLRDLFRDALVLDSGADLLSGSDEIPRLLGSKCTRKQLLQLVSVAEDTYQRALQNANNALLITKFCADLRQAIGR